MNKKENEQLKKIEKLDQELDNTINKIGAPKAKPVKLSKKKLALYILIPFSIACVISAVASFFLIDPFHWYTNSRLSLEQQEEKEIERLNKEFEDLNLASGLDNTRKIEDLLWEVKHHPIINDILKNPNDTPANTNELKSVTSKKSNESNLSDQGENITIKILVNTGSLRKEIDINLNVIIDNKKVKYIKSFLEYKPFLDEIKKAIDADGKKRVSDLSVIIKNIIDKNNTYKEVFKDIEYDITNDKDDNEIIASGPKTLNVNFNFTENNKLISSLLKLNVDLQGKSRKDINKIIANKIDFNYSFGFKEIYVGNYYGYTSQTAFIDKSTYQDLIDELRILFSSKNNFYFSEKDISNEYDNTDSKLNVDFMMEGKSLQEISKQTITSDGKPWKKVELELKFFIGNKEDKSSNFSRKDFSVNLIEKDYVHKDFLLYLSKINNAIWQAFLNYEFTTTIGDKYGDLITEFKKEIDRVTKNIDKPININAYDFKIYFINANSSQKDSDIISIKIL